ncbi:MAG: hypothetical protein DCC55_30990 [Chloroflexi bacterium]|nr:MAG: hypothetical protein DCC55_30990 [Chloroflexota bacterium]
MVRESMQKFPSWAMWIVGLLTLVAAALLILAIVLGVQAGQRQLEIQNRQEVAIALADAIDLHAQGDYEAALNAYKYVLQLEPDNNTARTGIQDVLALVARGQQPARVELPAPAAVTEPSLAVTNTVTTSPTATTAPAGNTVTSSGEALMQAAATAYGAGRWQEAISRLVALRQTDPTYQPDRVTDMLFEAYVNLGTEKDNENNLEEALSFFDKALQLHPDDIAVRAERTLIARYLDVLTFFGADWERAVQTLEELYALEPGYRDVAVRLQQARIAYGDALVARSDPCGAVEQYTVAATLATTNELVAKRDEAMTRCDEGDPFAVAAGAGASEATPVAATSGDTPAQNTPSASTAAPSGAIRGQILYSARDTTTGRHFISTQPLGGNAPPLLLQEDGVQPALRPDGQRLLFRNVRDDMRGIAAVDPGTGLLLQFSRFTEDSMPSWNPQGNRLAFASNREGDRIWRIYAKWAEVEGETTTLTIGEAPAWHPTSDLIAFRGCDATGNACGIWVMNGSGGDRAPLTTVQADNRPAWSPNGRHIVFMSDGRDGNMEIYRLDTSSGQVLRLTDNPAIDGLPTVSPDGRWVAFVSNRDGSWKIWYVSMDGGAAAVLTPINGDLGNWLDQGIQWVN